MNLGQKMSSPIIVRWLLLLWLVALSPSAMASAEGASPREQPNAGQRTVVYRGAWFEVRYPAGFTVRQSLRSSTADGYDSAEFVSPDRSVSLYVYSPQWGGEPADIALDPEREMLLTEQHRQEGARKVRLFTISARDGSYQRSYRDTVDYQGTVRTIVGIKYQSKKARLRYQKSYELFRSSLKQFAD
jgi:hypothetical protein